VFMRSIEVFADRDDVKQILLAIPQEDEELVTVKWGANLKFYGVKLCFGREKRYETVAEALKLVRDDADFIAVHDAVRCCITKQWVDAVFDAARQSGAAILASAVVSTLKEVRDDTIVRTVDRQGLYEAQTPQVFRAELLKKAYRNIDDSTGNIYDDAQLVEALGEKVTIVPVDSSNIKITYPADIIIAEGILKSRPKPKPKGPMGPYIEAPW